MFWHKCNNSSKNSLYCSFYYLFDTSHFFFLLRKKTPMTNSPSNPKTTGKALVPKFPISKIAAITIKIIPTNSAIFSNIILHMLISPRMLYRLSLERLSLYFVLVYCLFTWSFNNQVQTNCFSRTGFQSFELFRESFLSDNCLLFGSCSILNKAS
jgi:hypothetical protein